MNYNETITTLRYASRAKQIKNQPKVNSTKDAMFLQFQEEIKALKAKLKEMESRTVEPPPAPPANEALVEELRQKAEQEKVVLESEKAMQEQLIQGGVSLMDKAKQQESELARYQQEAAEQKRLAIEDQYQSTRDEIESKTKKLKKAEFESERADMLETIRQLQYQLKLKILIINNFIPLHEVEKIEKRAAWDEVEQQWKIPGLTHAGNNVSVPSSCAAPCPPARHHPSLVGGGDFGSRFPFSRHGSDGLSVTPPH
ncbi:putative kinesin family member 3A [Paratrimastix pyriformis]|uniref:Kinesin family member 3A n=1 Tax=Paratrimastix pyriformis TaxID=342808 RepID=A0ABQ8UR05_9EUKA|nr:putative kinesin family member 3A [Paratrimastix pyriformis]